MLSRKTLNGMMAMDKLPDWAERIPLIRTALTKVTTEVIDQRQIGELFGVSAYRARRLIRDIGPMLHGNSLVVDAQDVHQLLSEMERDHTIRDLQRRLTGDDAKKESGRRKIEGSVAQH
jgi:hypothetical protein